MTSVNPARIVYLPSNVEYSLKSMFCDDDDDKRAFCSALVSLVSDNSVIAPCFLRQIIDMIAESKHAYDARQLHGALLELIEMCGAFRLAVLDHLPQVMYPELAPLYGAYLAGQREEMPAIAPELRHAVAQTSENHSVEAQEAMNNGVWNCVGEALKEARIEHLRRNIATEELQRMRVDNLESVYLDEAVKRNQAERRRLVYETLSPVASPAKKKARRAGGGATTTAVDNAAGSERESESEDEQRVVTRSNQSFEARMLQLDVFVALFAAEELAFAEFDRRQREGADDAPQYGAEFLQPTLLRLLDSSIDVQLVKDHVYLCAHAKELLAAGRGETETAEAREEEEERWLAARQRTTYATRSNAEPRENRLERIVTVLLEVFDELTYVIDDETLSDHAAILDTDALTVDCARLVSIVQELLARIAHLAENTNTRFFSRFLSTCAVVGNHWKSLHDSAIFLQTCRSARLKCAYCDYQLWATFPGGGRRGAQRRSQTADLSRPTLARVLDVHFALRADKAVELYVLLMAHMVEGMLQCVYEEQRSARATMREGGGVLTPANVQLPLPVGVTRAQFDERVSAWHDETVALARKNDAAEEEGDTTIVELQCAMARDMLLACVSGSDDQ